MLDVVQGGTPVERALKDMLKILQSKSENAEFKALMGKVLSGEVGLREAVFGGVFEAEFPGGLGEPTEKYKEMSEEERERIFSRSDEILEKFCKEVESSGIIATDGDGEGESADEAPDEEGSDSYRQRQADEDYIFDSNDPLGRRGN